MKVILKQDVESLGHMGDLVEVSVGYARNFLIPKSKAIEATVKNVKTLEHEKRVIADQGKKIKKEFEALAEKIGATPVTITAQAGEGEKLFGSVTNKDIAEALVREGIEVDKRKILLDDPLKELGQFTVSIQIHHEVTAHLKVTVVKAE